MAVYKQGEIFYKLFRIEEKVGLFPNFDRWSVSSGLRFHLSSSIKNNKRHRIFIGWVVEPFLKANGIGELPQESRYDIFKESEQKTIFIVLKILLDIMVE